MVEHYEKKNTQFREGLRLLDESFYNPIVRESFLKTSKHQDVVEKKRLQ